MDQLLNVTRFYFAQSVFTSKTHYKAYDRLQKRQDLLRNIGIVIAGFTLIVLVLQIVGVNKNLSELVDILSVCGLSLTAASIILLLATRENISEIKMQHKLSAEEYLAIRDNFMLLIAKFNIGISNKEKSTVDDLVGEYSVLGKYSPTTTYNDYKNAQFSLGLKTKNNEEFTWSDEDIDKFLPGNLRLTK